MQSLIADARETTPANRADCILIVEDSRTYAELLRRSIRRVPDFEVLVAGSLADAVTLAERHRERILLAVLDLNLPDAPHGEIVDAMLARDIPSVVLTGTFDERVRQQIIAKNIVDYVVKESVHDLEYVVQLIRRIDRNRSIKVLVVDDSATYRHVLRQNLVSCRFQVLEAANGDEALAQLHRHGDVRLVITDNQMPGMDGFELTTEIRKSYSKEEVAVIGLSAASGGSLSAKFLKRGANDFLAKPYSREEFFCRVSQNLELIELVHEIRDSSNRDYLTGLYNRRYYFEVGEKYFANAVRNHLELAVAMFDIDFFKVVNDSYGHAAGDAVIRRVAETIAENLRRTDLVARFGGEEFCVLAVNPGPAMPDLFERIRALVAATAVRHEGVEIRVTVSVGVVFGLGVTLADTLRQADQRLYAAKQQGRDRVVCAAAERPRAVATSG